MRETLAEQFSAAEEEFAQSEADATETNKPDDVEDGGRFLAVEGLPMTSEIRSANTS